MCLYLYLYIYVIIYSHLDSGGPATNDTTNQITSPLTVLIIRGQLKNCKPVMNLQYKMAYYIYYMN